MSNGELQKLFEKAFSDEIERGRARVVAATPRISDDVTRLYIHIDGSEPTSGDFAVRSSGGKVYVSQITPPEAEDGDPALNLVDTLRASMVARRLNNELFGQDPDHAAALPFKPKRGTVTIATPSETAWAGVQRLLLLHGYAWLDDSTWKAWAPDGCEGIAIDNNGALEPRSEVAATPSASAKEVFEKGAGSALAPYEYLGSVYFDRTPLADVFAGRFVQITRRDRDGRLTIDALSAIVERAETLYARETDRD